MYIQLISLLVLVLGWLVLLPMLIHFVGFCFQACCWLFVYDFIPWLTFCYLFCRIIFETVDFSIVVAKIRNYVESNGFFIMFLWSITLVILVVIHFLIFWLVYIFILLFILVGHSLFHLSVERSGKGRVVIVFCVSSVFVSHSIEQLVGILLRSRMCGKQLLSPNDITIFLVRIYIIFDILLGSGYIFRFNWVLCLISL